jgi:hypothetical protein
MVSGPAAGAGQGKGQAIPVIETRQRTGRIPYLLKKKEFQ